MSDATKARPPFARSSASGMAVLDLRHAHWRSGRTRVRARSGHSAALAWLGGHPRGLGTQRRHHRLIRRCAPRSPIDHRQGGGTRPRAGHPRGRRHLRPAPERGRPPRHPPAAARPAPPAGGADGRAGCGRGADPPVHQGVLEARPGRLRGEGAGRQAARAGRRRGPQLPLRPQGHRQRRDARRTRHHLRLHRRGHRPLRARRGGRRRAVLLHAHPAPGRRRRRDGREGGPGPAAPRRGHRRTGRAARP